MTEDAQQPQAETPPPDAASEEELRAAIEEQLKRITVRDVLLQTVVTLVNLGGRRLGLAGEDAAQERDLDQARTAIEAIRALMPLLPADDAAAVRDALSQLQMVYAREAGPDPGAAPGGGEAPADGPSDEEAERAKARAKLWTPPGA